MSLVVVVLELLHDRTQSVSLGFKPFVLDGQITQILLHLFVTHKLFNQLLVLGTIVL